MSRLVIFLCVLTIFSYADSVHAFYNDTNVIELEDVDPPVPDEPPPGEEAGGGGDTTNDQSSDSSQSSSSNEETNTSSDSSSTASQENSSTEESTDPNDVINELLEANAIEGLVLISSSETTSGTSYSFGSGAGSVVTIIGSKVRDVLRGRGDLRDILNTWRTLRDRGNADAAREYGLMAISMALSDENVQEISLTASRFDITYRSRGYLLAVIPWSFPVRVTVIPQAPAGSRVTVKLPWYRFFVREFFTTQKLTSDLEVALVAAATSATDGADQQVVLFETIARELRSKVGTVSDSVLLGTSAQE